MAKGPLRVHPANPRYFTDGSGKVVFVTGSHTWNNLQEITRLPERSNPTVDFDEYLDFLEARKHNCFRLWAWEHAASFDAAGRITYRQDPMPYLRTGPGDARDGEPKFDLTKFNQLYFDRMRERVIAARDRGMYVIVMLFQGFSITEKDKDHHDPWPGHPFHADNNINSIDGDPDKDGKGLEVHSLTVPAITAVHEAYVAKVIDTVNDLSNVLYEITNEDNGGPANTAWQYHIIRFIKTYEAGKPTQHPVGMTVQWPDGGNSMLFESPADWISPSPEGGYQTDPPAADGSKVILNDTDHSFFFTALQKVGIGGQRAWVWKSFTRGQQTLFMDPYIDPAPWYVLTRNGPQNGKPDPYWDTLRINMGYTRMYADRMNLAAMKPEPGLASSGYCLASTAADGAEYLVYLPQGPWVTVDLSAVSSHFRVEWFNPSTGAVVRGEPVAGGARRALTSPFDGDAVLYMAQVAEGARG
ncbi:MAG TPA: DUF6298 domain-containing protein [Phycisphaerae bacterium]|nr:DUF6298 domain-containing protein [Phycisphaerae bacterium]